MNNSLEVGIICDFDPGVSYHVATNEALGHAARALSVTVNNIWILTESLHAQGSESALRRFDALWCAPRSPYRSATGAHRGIRFARENGWPFVAT